MFENNSKIFVLLNPTTVTSSYSLLIKIFYFLKNFELGKILFNIFFIINNNKILN